MNEQHPEKEKTNTSEDYLNFLPSGLKTLLTLYLDTETLINLTETYPYYDSLIKTNFTKFFNPELQKPDTAKMIRIKSARDKANETLLQIFQNAPNKEEIKTQEDYFKAYFEQKSFEERSPETLTMVTAIIESDNSDLLNSYFNAIKTKFLHSNPSGYCCEKLSLFLSTSISSYALNCFNIILSYLTYLEFDSKASERAYYLEENLSDRPYKRDGIDLSSIGLALTIELEKNGSFFAKPAVAMKLLEFLQKCIFETKRDKKNILLVAAAAGFFDEVISKKMDQPDRQQLIDELSASHKKLICLIGTYYLLNEDYELFKFMLENFNPSTNISNHCDQAELVKILSKHPSNLYMAGRLFYQDFIVAQKKHLDIIPDANCSLLMIAVKKNILNFVELLLAHDANPDHADASGRCAIDYIKNDYRYDYNLEIRALLNPKVYGDNAAAVIQLTKDLAEKDKILSANGIKIKKLQEKVLNLEELVEKQNSQLQPKNENPHDQTFWRFNS